MITTFYLTVKKILIFIVIGLALPFGCGIIFSTPSYSLQFAYIPEGTFKMDDSVYTVKSFELQAMEVSNEEYWRFLESLRLQERAKEYADAFPDTTLLQKQMWICRHLNYFTHPMFRTSPVVGINRAQVQMYINWLNEQEDAGIRSQPRYRLPSDIEWKYAALAGNEENIYGNNSGINYRNSKGCELMHFFNLDSRMAIYGDSAGFKDVLYNLTNSPYYELEWDKILSNTKNLKKIGIKHYGSALPLIGMPVPTYSYFPNDYGLYNMSGNVAELVKQDGKHIVVGGSFRTDATYCEILSKNTHPALANAKSSDVGFRVVRQYLN